MDYSRLHEAQTESTFGSQNDFRRLINENESAFSSERILRKLSNEIESSLDSNDAIGKLMSLPEGTDKDMQKLIDETKKSLHLDNSFQKLVGHDSELRSYEESYSQNPSESSSSFRPIAVPSQYSEVYTSLTADQSMESDIGAKLESFTCKPIPKKSINYRSMVLHIPRTQRERLIGEIAFQLDRRILQSIFPEQRRLYGFCVRNIDQKIKDLSTSLEGEVNIELKATLESRRNIVLEFLKNCAKDAGGEYDFQFHPFLAETLVNNFGVVKKSKEANKEMVDMIKDEGFLRSVIEETVEPVGLRAEITVLLHCLVNFSQAEKKPLFVL